MKARIIILFGMFCVFIVIPAVVPMKLFADEYVPVKITDFPEKDFPSEVDKENVIGESAKNFYYGIGGPVDYVKARYAALLEMEPMTYKVYTGDEQYFCPASILMMIYANGFGVQKNIDLSIRLAQCNLPGTPLEIEDRVNHLKRLKWFFFSGVFDVSDDIPIYSGDKKTFAEESKKDYTIRSQDQFNLDIEKRLPNQKKWTQEQVRAFINLEKAANTYFTKRIYNEVDDSGTARAEYQEDERDKLENSFLDDLNRFEKGHFLNFSPSDYKKADSKLTKTYNQIIKLKDFQNCGSINPVGIRVVQRRWLTYREAWAQFGVLRYPKFNSKSLRTWLTKARLTQLDEFLDCAK